MTGILNDLLGGGGNSTAREAKPSKPKTKASKPKSKPKATTTPRRKNSRRKPEPRRAPGRPPLEEPRDRQVKGAVTLREKVRYEMYAAKYGGPDGDGDSLSNVIRDMLDELCEQRGVKLPTWAAMKKLGYEEEAAQANAA